MENKKIMLIVLLIIIGLLGITIAIYIAGKEDTNVNEITVENNVNTLDIQDVNVNSTMNEEQINNQIANEIDETEESSQPEEINNNDENLNIESDNVNNQRDKIKINLIVNNKTFSATLENNETTRALTSMFPMALNMSDLHSNEKYNYLNSSLTTNSSVPRMINAGDIKLYGNNCLVVFYGDFRNSYSYTNLGKVDNVDDFIAELGSGSVNIRFELAEQK